VFPVYLGRLTFLHADTVEALDEVVEHLSLHARLDGEAVAAGLRVNSPCRHTQTTQTDGE
jgi:hypothetical protein